MSLQLGWRFYKVVFTIFSACSFTLMTRNTPISVAEPPLDADRQLTPVSLRIIQ